MPLETVTEQLQEIAKKYKPTEVRVLPRRDFPHLCGFVIFDNVQNAKQFTRAYDGSAALGGCHTLNVKFSDGKNSCRKVFIGGLAAGITADALEEVVSHPSSGPSIWDMIPVQVLEYWKPDVKLRSKPLDIWAMGAMLYEFITGEQFASVDALKNLLGNPPECDRKIAQAKAFQDETKWKQFLSSRMNSYDQNTKQTDTSNGSDKKYFANI